MHTKEVKVCKYFTGKQNCPFEKIGCMFSHDDFLHQTTIDDIEDFSEEGTEDIEDISEESGEDSDDYCVLVENQCHLCKKELNTKDELFDHVQAEHEEYYNGMLEIAANMSKNNFAEC